jgi:hypothetical protein
MVCSGLVEFEIIAFVCSRTFCRAGLGAQEMNEGPVLLSASTHLTNFGTHSADRLSYCRVNINWYALQQFISPLLEGAHPPD